MSCGILPCIMGNFIPPNGMSCQEWQDTCVQERDAVRKNWGPAEHYKDCIKGCQEIFSPSYRGPNRMSVEQKCYDNCKNK